jgi:hypothetical protein
VVVRNARISQNGFIVMGKRPKWKILKVEDFEGGEKCKDFSKNGFIVMGNRPK